MLRALAILCAGALLAAQDPPASETAFTSLGFVTVPSGLSYRAFDVPEATHAAIVAAVRAGAWHDPPERTGLAHVVSVLLSLAQAERPEADRWVVTAAGPITLIGVTCARADVDARAAELLRLLHGGVELTDDLVARAKAMAVLRADELLELVPGPLLLERARRRVYAGTPAGKQFFGVPAEMQALTRAELAAHIDAAFRPAQASLVVLGAVAGTGVAERLAADQPDARPAVAPPQPTVHDSAGPIPDEGEHQRVLAPFVTVAIKAPPPDGPGYLAYLIAMGVVKVRCHNTFGAYRGGEHEAGFPFWWCNYRRADGYAVINRRGANGDSADDVRGEVRAMIKRLRTQPPDLQEVMLAAGEVARGLMLPPYERELKVMARSRGLLGPRAELLATAHALGWPASLQLDAGRVLLTEVVSALQASLADSNLIWLALVPKAGG